MIEVRNVEGGKYEMRMLDEWVPVTREEIARHQRKGHVIYWNPRDTQ